MNNLSRNNPIALVFGAAGFIGSHLVDLLLTKNIQVVGVDNFSSGSRENLYEAAKSRWFLLFNQSAELDLPVDLPRLDYAFFLIPDDISKNLYFKALENFLKIGKCPNVKVLVVSSIDLYDSDNTEDTLAEAENRLANFATENNINARVVRLAGVYGSRMNFRNKEPIFKLIRAALDNSLHKQIHPLDFGTRSLFISDAVDLLIKAVMHGSTAQKIYDGALLEPIKLSEIKQLLLDPLWYEHQGFEPTKLPAWPTPNLVKTQKELAWKPTVSIMAGLRSTIQYLKDNAEVYQKTSPQEITQPGSHQGLIRYHLNHRGQSVASMNDSLMAEPKIKLKFFRGLTKVKKLPSLIIIFLGIAIIGYAVIWPIVEMGIGTLAYNHYFGSGYNQLLVGDIKPARANFDQAKVFTSGSAFKAKVLGVAAGINLPMVQRLIGSAKLNNAMAAMAVTVTSSYESFQQSLYIVFGEREGNFIEVVNKSNADLKLLEEQLVYLSSDPTVEVFERLINQLEASYFILAKAIPVNQEKNYLVLLLDNRSLNPGGGQIVSYARLNFKDGKFTNLKSGPIDSIEEDNTGYTSPPVELKNQLGERSWSLKYSNFDSNFAVNAQWAKFFYQKQTGEIVNGVVSIDLTALGKIYQSFDGKISEEFMNSNLTEGLNKLFYLADQNRLAQLELTAELVKQKHIQAHFFDPGLYSYIKSAQEFKGLDGRKVEKTGNRQDVLAWSEQGNVLESYLNYFIKRDFELQLRLNSQGLLTNQLTVVYNSQDIPEQGKTYQGIAWMFVPSGSRLTKASWNDKDILREVKAFSDYGLSGFRVPIDLGANQQTKLYLEYVSFKPLVFIDNHSQYSLEVIKQPGTQANHFLFKINYPSNMKPTLVDETTLLTGQLEQSQILDSDYKFQANFQKTE